MRGPVESLYDGISDQTLSDSINNSSSQELAGMEAVGILWGCGSIIMGSISGLGLYEGLQQLSLDVTIQYGGQNTESLDTVSNFMELGIAAPIAAMRVGAIAVLSVMAVESFNIARRSRKARTALRSED